MVIRLFRDKLNEALYLVELVELSGKTVEKKERKKKKKREKNSVGFLQRCGLWFSHHFPSFFLELSSVVS